MTAATRIKLALAAVLIAVAPHLGDLSSLGLGVLGGGKAALCCVIETLPRSHDVALVTMSPEADTLRAAGVWRQLDASDLPDDLPALKTSKVTPPALILLSDSGGVVYSGTLPKSAALLQSTWHRYGGKP